MFKGKPCQKAERVQEVRIHEGDLIQALNGRDSPFQFDRMKPFEVIEGRTDMYTNYNFWESIVWVPTQSIEFAGFSVCNHKDHLGFTFTYCYKIGLGDFCEEVTMHFDALNGF